jgi:hypothetical protein
MYSIYLPGQFVYIDPYLYSRFRVQSTLPVRFGDINEFNPSIRLRDRLALLIVAAFLHATLK